MIKCNDVCYKRWVDVRGNENNLFYILFSMDDILKVLFIYNNENG